jgi:toxic protein SymE
MAYKEYRNLTVTEISGYQYKNTPAIRIQGQWLSELGFELGDKVKVKCEDGCLTITKEAATSDIR